MSRHSHGDSHHHHHHGQKNAAVTYDKAFIISIIANGLFVLIQIVFAYLSNSTSLLADAFHNLGDVLGLVLAWTATVLMKRAPTMKATYGLKKTSILSALANGILLVFTCGIIATDAVYKLFSPSEVQALSVMIVAGIGIVINSATALLFAHGSEDLNIRGAYLHLFYDALVSVGVVLSAALLYWTGWQWIDPVVGLLIALVILKGTWALFAGSFRLIIDGVPDNISWTAVSDFLLSKPGVKGFHDLHIWAMSTQENAMSVHLHMPDDVLSDALRAEWVEQLRQEFNIQHVTIQVERTKTDCNDACHHPKFL
ncbi:cation diffusion facilitator family transporter [Fluoribacter gormanii]|uniref:Cadmium, cobalt and zinc/H(+)-K(+) antiporter n=1 Tax=Fluoribacter gormanii TaxID=464 RepID=A0A377GF91_9GAMM|nr:cation diffusion facilitator family transporter [Fluoribacter gormanii]KTD01682.1 cation efflux system protein [Fluoribacter gormanii]MCW8444964.1 cation diffusion facilitator family transporter [Fluoribacter gormanii]MCW8470174.1 cation diffusion facilitator family transporter [Fluoribacter gormanii]SIR92007.1 cobalt-zinc-cadmium efflux system protein [Fluoribacter gormanii]STO23469.1 Cadmium, cobalt and zinc/H(+)-K(+) antiporter [Fluoribacter gormanii]